MRNIPMSWAVTLLVLSVALSIVACKKARPSLDAGTPVRADFNKAEGSTSGSQETRLRPGADEPALQDQFSRLEMVSFEFASLPPSLLKATLSRDELHSYKLPLPRDLSWVALDEHPPRLVEGRKLSASELLTEDLELAPSGHTLTLLYEKSPSVIAVAQHPFTVEVDRAPAPSHAGCLVFTRKLTFNGVDETAGLKILVVPLLKNLTRVVLQATGAGVQSRAEIPLGQWVGLPSVKSGDVEIQATCFGSDVEYPPATRTITVNLEANPPTRAP